MKIPIFTIFKFIMVISTWATTALEDGKITAAEGLELIAELASIIGVPLELELPPEVTETIGGITGEDQSGKDAAFLSKPEFDTPDK